MEGLLSTFQKMIEETGRTDILFFGVLVILTCAVIVLETINRRRQEKQTAAGIEPQIRSVVTPSLNTVATREYISNIQLLAGKPDALIIENGFIIPVERKSLSNKIRDRYIAQLLVYMRLIEEFEGKKPPYGYLILGKNSRQVKIINTEARQKWLQGILDEMQSFLEKKSSLQAKPEIRKCRKCGVAQHCNYKI